MAPSMAKESVAFMHMAAHKPGQPRKALVADSELAGGWDVLMATRAGDCEYCPAGGQPYAQVHFWGGPGVMCVPKSQSTCG
jgi:hypothetical protein